MKNRKQKTGNVKPGELTRFLFSIFGFLFSIALSVGRFEKIDTPGKEGGSSSPLTKGGLQGGRVAWNRLKSGAAEGFAHTLLG